MHIAQSKCFWIVNSEKKHEVYNSPGINSHDCSIILILAILRLIYYNLLKYGIVNTNLQIVILVGAPIKSNREKER